MDEIFYLVRHGGGGFSYWDVYNMPIHIRKYNVKKLSQEIQLENEKIEEAKRGQGEGKNMTMKQIATGNAKDFKKPDYTAKAPRK